MGVGKRIIYFEACSEGILKLSSAVTSVLHLWQFQIKIH